MIMSQKKIILATLALFCGTGLAGIHARSKNELIYAFRNYDATRKTKMLLVGEIRSKTKVAEPHKVDSPYLNYDSRADQVTVKVANPEGVKVGQKLYVIDKNPYHSRYRNGLIVGEITVRSLIHTPYYGWVLNGEGNLLRVREGNFVARTLETEKLEKAFVVKKRGDLYRNRGLMDRAISSYSEALEADDSLPEAHTALAGIYFEMAQKNGYEDPVRAYSQYELAWKYRENFRFSADELLFYKNFLEVLRFRYEFKQSHAGRKVEAAHLLDRMRETAQEANQLAPDDTDVLISLFYVYFSHMDFNASGEDKTARDIYEKNLNKSMDTFKKLLKRPLSDPLYHKTAVLFLRDLGKGPVSAPGGIDEKRISELYGTESYALYRASRMIQADKNPLDMRSELIQYHLEKYFRYGASLGIDYDPVMISIRRQYNE